MNTKYIVEEASEWVNSPSDELLIGLVKKYDTEEIKEDIFYCHMHKRVTRSYDDGIDFYQCVTYGVENYGQVNTFKTREVILSKNDTLYIHRYGVIRNGIYISFLNDMKIKIFDDENSSHRQIIERNKKINFYTKDLQINDVIVYEVTTKVAYQKLDDIAKKFFKYVYTFPIYPEWAYGTLEFSMLNERNEDIQYITRFERDVDELLHEDNVHTLLKGDRVDFERYNYRALAIENVNNPYIEFASINTWLDISNYVSKIYESEINEGIKFKGLPKFEAENEDDSIRKIIEYVQNKISYTFDVDYMYNYVPQSVEHTLTNYSGDCKAKSVLLVSILKKMGYDAIPILPILVSWGAKDLEQTFISPFIFSHVMVLLRFKGKDYFIDATEIDKKGALSNRGEEIIDFYLPLEEGAHTIVRPHVGQDFYYVEQYVKIHVDNMKWEFVDESIFRKAVADSMRNEISKEKIKESKISELKCFGDEFDMDRDFYKEREISSNIEIFDEIEENTIRIVKHNSFELKEGDKTNLFENIFYRHCGVMEISDVINYKEKDYKFYYVDGWQRMRTVEIDLKGKYIVTTNDFNNENIEEDNAFFYFSKSCELNSTHAKNVVIYKPKYRGYVNEYELDFLKGKAMYINDGNLCGAWFTFTKDPSGLLTSDEYQKSKNIFSKITDLIKK